jgi:hypothetical protein
LRAVTQPILDVLIEPMESNQTNCKSINEVLSNITEQSKKLLDEKLESSKLEIPITRIPDLEFLLTTGNEACK